MVYSLIGLLKYNSSFLNIIKCLVFQAMISQIYNGLGSSISI